MAMPDAAQSAHALAPCCSKLCFVHACPAIRQGRAGLPTAIAGRSPLPCPPGTTKSGDLDIVRLLCPLAPLAISKLTRCPSANVLNP